MLAVSTWCMCVSGLLVAPNGNGTSANTGKQKGLSASASMSSSSLCFECLWSVGHPCGCAVAFSLCLLWICTITVACNHWEAVGRGNSVFKTHIPLQEGVLDANAWLLMLPLLEVIECWYDKLNVKSISHSLCHHSPGIERLTSGIMLWSDVSLHLMSSGCWNDQFPLGLYNTN